MRIMSTHHNDDDDGDGNGEGDGDGDGDGHGDDADNDETDGDENLLIGVTKVSRQIHESAAGERGRKTQVRGN